MTAAHVIAARRSAVCPGNGAFAALDFDALAAPVIRAVLADAGVAPEEVDELVLSNALGAGGNPARIAALAAGLPERVAGLSIDRQCAGGLDALAVAQALVLSGQARIVVAGGAESWSRRPHRARRGPAGPEPYEQARFTPWPDRDPAMTAAAAGLADRLGIRRIEQDAWAVESHARACAALHVLRQEIVDIAGVCDDPFTRDLKLATAARAPVLQGTVTTATTAVAADGAAFCVVSAAPRGPRALRIAACATLGGNPEEPGLAPLPAIAAVLARTGLTPHDLTAIEVMEAYAAQAIACVRGADLPQAKVNRGGGALARGHPIGASGAILAVRLFHDLRDGAGLAAIAAAGGIGSALILTA